MSNSGRSRSLLDLVRRRLASPTLSITLFVAVVILLLMNVAGLRLYGGSYDPGRFGTVGEWFSGTTASIAILFAWLSFSHEREMAENARMESDPIIRERAESSKVFAWVEAQRDASGVFVREIRIVVHNDTPVPVYKWTVSDAETNVVIEGNSNSGPLMPGRNMIHVDRRDPSLQARGSGARLVLRFLGKNNEWLIRGSEGAFRLATVVEIAELSKL